MFLSQRPMQYVDHYGGYQPDYQEASMEHNDWISEEIHYLGDQEDSQFQPYNNNLSYWSEDVENPEDQAYPPFQGQQWGNYQNDEHPQDQDYTPFQNQQGQGYFQPNPQFNNFQQEGANYFQSSQDDDIMSMLRQLLEGQEREKEEIAEMKACFGDLEAYHNDLNSNFEGIATHVKELENQIAQAASISENNGTRVLPEKPEPNPNEYCQDIILRRGTELPSRGEAESIDESKEKTEEAKDEELPVEKEAESEVLAEENISEKKKGKEVEESPKTEEKTEFVETQKPEEEKILVDQESDSKTLKEEDSQQKVLKVKQDDFGLLDAIKVGNEKLLDSHKIHDGEASFLELKEELNALELKEASNGKTSMERELSELHEPNLELKPPLPQELRYEFSDANFTYPVIVNDTLCETETKTFLFELISDSRWVPPMHVEPKKGKVNVVNIDRDELIPTRTIASHRMCSNYRELNASTRKYHFPWPFTDQMLFIFSSLIENVWKVFMEDFSLYGDALVSCMSNLCRKLKRCEDTNLVLNWKKCHFMEREGTTLGPRTSEEDIEVNKAKVAGPLTHLLCKDTSFDFNEACLEAFTKITRELVNESIVHVPDWSFPFESGGDFKAALSEPLTA